MHNVEFTFNIWSNMKHKKVLKYSLCVCVCVFQCCTEAVLSQLCEGKTVWTRRDLSQRWRHLWRGWAGLVSRWLLSGTHSGRFTGKRKAVESWQMVNRSTKFSMKQALGWPEAHSCFALLTETGRKLCFFFLSQKHSESCICQLNPELKPHQNFDLFEENSCKSF